MVYGRKYINKVGAEFEVGISRNDFYNEICIPGFVAKHDASICCYQSGCRAREFVTDGDGCKGIEEVHRRAKELYKHVTEINDTMGLHFHFSLKTERDYNALHSIRFINFFIKELKKQDWYKGELKRRVEDGGACFRTGVTRQDIDRQYIEREHYHDARYRQINFVKQRFGTVEFRVFPAVKSLTLMYKYLKFTKNVIFEYLDNFYDEFPEGYVEAGNAEVDEEEIGELEMDISLNIDDTPEPESNNS